MTAVKHYCQDKWVLMYIERWLKAGVIQQDGNFTPTLTGTPQGGVISPLLANIFLHVVFDKWMEKYHPEKPFERYADDIVIHCKTERQALFMLKVIKHRFQTCKLQVQDLKTQIVNLRGYAKQQYAKGFDFLGFTIRPNGIKGKTGMKALPGIYVSTKSKKSIIQKFKEAAIHKWRKPLKEVAAKLNPVKRYHQLLSEVQARRVENGMVATQSKIEEMGQVGEGLV